MKPDTKILIEFVFGELDDPARADVAKRVRDDEMWRREHNLLLNVKASLEKDRSRFADADVPYGYWERFNGRLMERIHAAPGPGAILWKNYRTWTAPGLALAAMLVFFLFSVPSTSERIDVTTRTDEWLNSDTVVEALATYIQSDDLGESILTEESDDESGTIMSSDFNVDDVSLDILGDLEQLSRQEQQLLLERLSKEDII